jgi:Fe-S-cluster formation regulator IscX/YfhJ
MWEQIVSYLIHIAALGIGSFLVFLVLLPTGMAQKILNHYFDAKIAEVKHEHSKDLEHLQSALDHLNDRGARSNEKEYQAIAAVWESFVEAFYATSDCVVQFMAYPDLNNFDEDELTEFLESE